MKHDPALDGLRAIAVTAVVVYHVNPTILPGGWAGVEIFFVLSGYLITNILTAELDATGRIDLRSFYLRRLLRLAPALIALVATVLALLPFQGKPKGPALVEALAAITYTMNWFRAFGGIGEDALGHTWSLAMEEQYYLLWPFILLVTPARRRLLVAVSLVAIVTGWRCFLVYHGATPARTSDGFDTHSDALLIGCVLAFLLGDRVPAIRRGGARSVLAVGLLALFLLYAHYGSLFTQSAGLSIAALLSVALILCVRGEGWLRSLLVRQPVVFVGRISYGVYLWHYPLIVIAMRHVEPGLLWVPAITSYGVAIVSYYLIERPFLRLKRHFPPASQQLAAPDGVDATTRQTAA